MRALLFIAFVGCSGGDALPDAEPFRFSTWRLEIVATDTGSKLEVDVRFARPTYLLPAALPPELELSAAVRGQTFVLGPAGDDRFLGSLPLSMDVGGAEITVTVRYGDLVATSVGTFPASFEILSHTGFWPKFSVTWSPTSSDPFAWAMFTRPLGGHPAGCDFNPNYGTLPDTGMADVDLMNASGTAGYCTAELVLLRSRGMSMAPEFAKGSGFTTHEKRTFF